MKKIGGYLLAATAFIACPCHLVLLLPLAVGLLGGTALGATLEANTGLIFASATVYFVGALAAGLYLLTRRATDEEGSPVPKFDQETGTLAPRSRDRSGYGPREAGAREPAGPRRPS